MKFLLFLISPDFFLIVLNSEYLRRGGINNNAWNIIITTNIQIIKFSQGGISFHRRKIPLSVTALDSTLFPCQRYLSSCVRKYKLVDVFPYILYTLIQIREEIQFIQSYVIM